MMVRIRSFEEAFASYKALGCGVLIYIHIGIMHKWLRARRYYPNLSYGWEAARRI
jgi:hypothetical protein